MDRASMRDLEQPYTLILRQLSDKFETPLNAIYVSLFRLAFSAIDRVDPEIPQMNCYLMERPALAPRVQRDRHRRSTA